MTQHVSKHFYSLTMNGQVLAKGQTLELHVTVIDSWSMNYEQRLLPVMSHILTALRRKQSNKHCNILH